MNLTPILTPVPVATATDAQHDGSKLMLLTACDSQLEAEILIGRLKSEGIEAMVSGTGLEATLGSSDAGSDPYHVLIHQSDAERALRIIGSDASWTEEQLNEYISRLE